ncbi:MAG TPA: type VI secretion system baseplate subunit TssE [Pyrinomonadaceae bacterium]|nr:type VI secretion system baseplate subunit TssE [Pyrinomonadaceae bacterium]
MSRTDHEIRIIPSVLDRLIDFEPKETKEAPKSRSRSLAELKQSVKRDLEWLLNTRNLAYEIPETLEEVQKSVLLYGLPDFTGFTPRNPNENKRLIKSLENAIKFFEPRFLDVKISVEPISNVERVLKFKIEARLDVEPTPEPIVFDTVLQLGSGDFEVKEK